MSYKIKIKNNPKNTKRDHIDAAPFRLKFQQFNKDIRGNVGMMFAVSALPLIAAIGAAIDHSQMSGEVQKAQDSVDAAVLSAAREYYVDFVKDDVSLVGKMSTEFHLGPQTTPGGYEVTTLVEDGERGTIQLKSSISGVSAHDFMGIFGQPETEWTVTASSEVSPPQVEIILVIDASHSMKGDRQTSLKSALNRFIEDVGPYKRGESHIAFTLLPYAENINFGQGANAWLDPSLGQFDVSNFNGCFKFSEWDMPGSMEASAIDGEAFGWPFCPPAGSEAILFSTNAETLTSYIEDIGLGWGTDSERGLVWSERLLNNGWRNRAAPFASESPVSITDNTHKMVLLLTDGAVSITDGNENGKKDSAKLIRNSRGQSLKAFEDQCDELAKIENLDVFTVAYSVENKKFEKILKRCVSGDGAYFDTSVENLDTVFQKVRERLMPLRLTQ